MPMQISERRAPFFGNDGETVKFHGDVLVKDA